jgi:membrane associated rhomboid family serine protease
MLSMIHAVALSRHTGTRLAEVGFLLILFAGLWIAAAEIPALKFPKARMIVAGAALAVAGVLLIIAVHSGHFG